MFCIKEGFSEDFIQDLDVWGFGKIYKYLKRIENRNNINLVGLFSTAANADKNQYKQYIKDSSVWLPEQERHIDRKTEDDFKKDINKGLFR